MGSEPYRRQYGRVGHPAPAKSQARAPSVRRLHRYRRRRIPMRRRDVHFQRSAPAKRRRPPITTSRRPAGHTPDPRSLQARSANADRPGRAIHHSSLAIGAHLREKHLNPGNATTHCASRFLPQPASSRFPAAGLALPGRTNSGILSAFVRAGAARSIPAAHAAPLQSWRSSLFTCPFR